MKLKLAALITLAASPAMAASKNPFSADFWSLSNTDMIVLIAFVIFVGVLIKFGVPGRLGSGGGKRGCESGAGGGGGGGGGGGRR